jgi:hypothetical protein
MGRAVIARALDFRIFFQDIAIREEGRMQAAPGGEPMVEPIKSGGVTPKISTPAAAPQAAVQAKAEAAPKSDTVQLSNEAQARSLRQQGLSIPEIAIQLRLDIKTVTGFFPQSS